MTEQRRRRFGSIRKLPSGRYQARYDGPDMATHKGPRTWAHREDAAAWLRSEEKLIEFDVWTPPDARETAKAAQSVTVAEYAATWNSQRDVKPTTRRDYTRYQELHLDPTPLGSMAVATVAPEHVRAWYAGLQKTGQDRITDAAKRTDGATRNARVYSWLRTVMADAVTDGLLDRNPVAIKGAGVAKRQRAIVVPSPAEVDEIAAVMPPDLALFVVLASWCAMRRGEVLGLRRRDVSPDGSTIVIRRAVSFVGREKVIASTKSGDQRTVAVPAHLAARIAAHLDQHAAAGPNGWVFPAPDGTPQDEWRLRKGWQKARTAIGRDDLRLHDLRHAGSMWAASVGATLAELQARLGHKSSAAAIRYMHAAQDSDRGIADRLAALAPTAKSGDTP